MATEQALLPMHDFLAQLQAWQSDRSPEQLELLRSSLDRVATQHGATGVHLHFDGPPLAPIDLGAGTLGADRQAADKPGRARLPLALPLDVTGRAELEVDGDAAETDALVDALELSLTAVWAQQAATAQRQQLEALDLAVRGIASIASVERVLQLIVDRVRELAGAQYAALGIIGSFGRIEQFITSGISAELRVRLGAPPQGHGLLGVIVREDRSLLIDDIATDARRYGFPEHHPEMHSLLGVPVRSKGRTIGNLYLTNKLTAERFSDADLRLVERFALHASIAIDNARLHEEIGRLAIVEERQRISQDLHDSIIQSLYAISLSLEDLPEVIGEDPAEGAARADRAIDSIHATIRDIRNFIMGLQPELLTDADLIAGLRTLAAEFTANTLIDLELQIDEGLPELSREASAHLLAITHEALSNIARHSGATRATLALAAPDGQMRLVIGDNGRGFDVVEARSARQRGLTNLHSRAEALRGTLNLESEPGAGTRVELRVPLAASGTGSNPD
jgi:signal transduction histidine kinase